MMELNILNIKGEDTGKTVILNDGVFGIEPNDHTIYLDVKQHMAAKRQGTHKSRERNALSGSTRKLIRQKGRGSARRGDIKSPILVGGVRAFGLKPRCYDFKLNKKVKVLARKSALSHKAKQNAIIIVENFTFVSPKTKEFISIVKELGLNNQKLLLVLPENNTTIYLSARNIGKVDVIKASDLNTYKVMNARNLVMTEEAVTIIEKILMH